MDGAVNRLDEKLEKVRARLHDLNGAHLTLSARVEALEREDARGAQRRHGLWWPIVAGVAAGLGGTVGAVWVLRVAGF